LSSLSVQYNKADNLAFVTLANPSIGNKLNLERLSALKEAFQRACEDPEVRIILLRSGKASEPWCLGMDLDLLASNLEASQSELREESVKAYTEVLELINRSPKPVIALIAGPVKAGGMGLAAACDMIFCTETASFELSEVLFGLIPANVMPWLLNRRVSMQKLRYLVLSAKNCSSEEAVQYGLADECFSNADADKELKKILKQILRAEPGALARVKAFSQVLAHESWDGGLKAAQTELLELMKRPELDQSLQAFKDGFTPPWFAKLKTQSSLFFGELDNE